jgi:hypothetical protein
MDGGLKRVYLAQIIPHNLEPLGLSHPVQDLSHE